jgi:hypothetical protein
MAATEQFWSASSLIGYLGAGVVAVAYFLNQKGDLRSDDWRFPATNLAGSLLVMVSLAYNLNAPSAVIEVFWSSISLYGIWKSLRGTRKMDP